MKLLLLIISFKLLAYTPSVESLFKNGANPDISGDIVSTKLKIERESLVPQENGEFKLKELYEKLLFRIEENRPLTLLQAVYTTPSMANSDLAWTGITEPFNTYSIKDENNFRRLYYSIISFLLLNRSNEMISFIKTHEPSVATNNELVDPEKKQILKQYKNYLQVIKDEPSLKGEIPNPMSPDDYDKKKETREILKRPYMQNQGFVKLIKEGGILYYQFKTAKFDALFELKKRRIKKLQFNSPEGIIKYQFKNYLLLDGKHELPKNIEIDTENARYKISVLQLVHVSTARKSFSTRLQEYAKTLKENDKNESNEMATKLTEFKDIIY